MVQLTGQFVPVKLDAEKEGKAAAEKYAVRGFPTILFLNASGEVEGKIGGYMPPDPFAAEMKKVKASHAAFPGLLRRSQTNPKDAEAAAKLATLYARRGNTERASALLTRAETVDPKNAGGHMTEAYLALGDYYQERRSFDRAIPLFRKAAATGKEPAQKAYAHLSIAVCHLSQNNTEAAVPELEATVALPGVPAEMKDQARKMLDQIRQRSSPQS